MLSFSFLSGKKIKNVNKFWSYCGGLGTGWNILKYLEEIQLIIIWVM